MPRNYIHGKKNKACCSLINHLEQLGVSAAVGHDNKHKATLTAYVDSESGFVHVPDQWQGFPVVKALRSELESLS